MINIAIVIGVSSYEHNTDLECCHADAQAIISLLKATEKFSHVKSVGNGKASDVKDEIRGFISSLDDEVDEVFFYFSGHGSENDQDFYFCLSDFQNANPNTTGLSNQELHDLIRPLKPNTFVKVIDACESGTRLIKASNLERYEKGSFNSFIQMAACQNDQVSLTGNPLSLFTESFIEAAIFKDSGAVYYTDIKDRLRDKFANNNSQTPYFVEQGTAREIFVHEASLLNNFRNLNSANSSTDTKDEITDTTIISKSLDSLLKERQENYANQELAQSYVDEVTESIGLMLKTVPDLDTAYDLDHDKNDSYFHDESVPFIVRVLEREPRNDRLVFTSIIKGEQEAGIGYPYTNAATLARMSFGGFKKSVEDYELELNCNLKRVQVIFQISPKYESLQKFKITISFAPSFPICYVFSVVERQMKTNWDSFGDHSKEISRKWFKGKWAEEHDWITEHIRNQISEALHNYFVAEGLKEKEGD